METPKFGRAGWFGMIAILLLAAGLRGGYAWLATDGGTQAACWSVQGAAEGEQASPAIPWLWTWAIHFDYHTVGTWLCLQVPLSTFSVLWLTLFVLWAFQRVGVALLAGVFAAVHPYWIVNAAEFADGPWAVFFLTLSLYLGTRTARVGGNVASFLLGISWGLLVLVRVETILFVMPAILWFVWRCRDVSGGWLCALLTLLGFGNAVLPWLVDSSNFLQTTPTAVTAAYRHLHTGNNYRADGGPWGRPSNIFGSGYVIFGDDRVSENRWPVGEELPSGPASLEFVRTNPSRALALRFTALRAFLLGMYADAALIKSGQEENSYRPALELWVPIRALALGMLGLLLVAGFLGWRFSAHAPPGHGLAILGLFLLPLPYVLSHAEYLVGPRLPWDAILIAFAAYGLIGWRRGPA